MRLSYLLKPLSLSKGKKKGAHESEVPFLRVEWLPGPDSNQRQGG